MNARILIPIDIFDIFVNAVFRTGSKIQHFRHPPSSLDSFFFLNFSKLPLKGRIHCSELGLPFC